MGNQQSQLPKNASLGWVQLETLPIGLSFNKTYASKAGDVVVYGYRKVYIYNKMTNKWKILAESSVIITPSCKYCDAMTFGNNAIHMIEQEHNECKWSKFVITNNKVNKLQTKYEFQTCTGLPTGRRAMSGIIINDDYHILTTNSNKEGLYVEHWVSNRETKQFDKIHTFDASTALCKCGNIYIPYKKEVWLIGGRYYDGQCSVYRTQKRIFIYSFESKKWKLSKLELPIGLELFGCILTNDEQYIIVFGGGSITDNDKEYESDNIFVINTKSMVINKSKIKCPTTGYFHAVNYSQQPNKSDLIISGFVAECYHVNMDMMNVINIINSDQPQLHWKILSGILLN